MEFSNAVSGNLRIATRYQFLEKNYNIMNKT